MKRPLSWYFYDLLYLMFSERVCWWVGIRLLHFFYGMDGVREVHRLLKQEIELLKQEIELRQWREQRSKQPPNNPVDKPQS
jgi:hypothetical protein